MHPTTDYAYKHNTATDSCRRHGLLPTPAASAVETQLLGDVPKQELSLTACCFAQFFWADKADNRISATRLWAFKNI